MTGSISLSSFDPGQIKATIYLLVVATDNRNRTGAAQLAVDVHAGPSFGEAKQYIGYLAENSLEFIVPVTVQVS